MEFILEEADYWKLLQEVAETLPHSPQELDRILREMIDTAWQESTPEELGILWGVPALLKKPTPAQFLGKAMELYQKIPKHNAAKKKSSFRS